ncbi:hypothetical protein K3Z95_01575 [Pseudomonas aeruginosa]|nr:hypothetical protein [Pseudomonas aeruginosa]
MAKWASIALVSFLFVQHSGRGLVVVGDLDTHQEVAQNAPVLGQIVAHAQQAQLVLLDLFGYREDVIALNHNYVAGCKIVTGCELELVDDYSKHLERADGDQLDPKSLTALAVLA